ncbi:MAG TPA: GNAT family N-acetyltransferase [Alphaproteobacteria bacterium]|nr:GNAT family N-acetyltransferase [Alphaproteobacteria bacterium]
MSEIAVARITQFNGRELTELCEAADDAIRAGGGFGWLKPPPRSVMESYWRGVLLVPERLLFIGRLDGVAAGSAQLLRPARNNEAQAHAATLTINFVAPWARGHGLARLLTRTAEEAARDAGFKILNLDVRETQEAAIQLYESFGYERWGRHPLYAMVEGKPVAGLFYFKRLDGKAE